MVAKRLDGGWRGVLIRGPSGAGKSDLALRALAAGWRLVADDRAIVWASGGRLFAQAPERLFGLIEARGLGIMGAPSLDLAEVVLIADLASGPDVLDRLPERAWELLEGVKLRRIALFGRESAAPAKLALALAEVTLGAGVERAYQARSVQEAKSARRGPGASDEE